MQLVGIKAIGLVMLFILTVGFSLLPAFITRKVRRTQDPVRRHRYELIMSLVSCFGGGIFLSTCLLDLFPEVEAQLDSAFKKMNVPSEYPCSEFIVIVGFLIVLVCEQVVLSWKESSQESHPLLGHSHNAGYGSHAEQSGSLNGISDHVHTPEEDMGHSIHEDPGSHSSLRSLVLVFALSLHSIFEGLAIGLQPNAEKMVQVLVAVIIHKSIIAFTLGLNLVQSKLRRRSVIECIAVFSLMSPIGMAIGLSIMNFDKGVEVFVISGILQGLACGTFLYVTFFEVLPHELNHGEERLLKLLFVILGVTTISVLLLVLPG